MPLFSWVRGRASVLKFEVLRGPSHPAEWTGFVPTAGLAHRPELVLERAVKLTGRVGAEPPTSARGTASSGAGEGGGVTLEVAIVLRSCGSSCRAKNIHGGIGSVGAEDGIDSNRRSTGNFSAKPQSSSGPSELKMSPFHADARRNPPEGGELVVHCLKARNLNIELLGEREEREVDPVLSLMVVPDGRSAITSAHAGGGRHPVWNQVSLGK